jgi:hypothetical protein
MHMIPRGLIAIAVVTAAVAAGAAASAAPTPAPAASPTTQPALTPSLTAAHYACGVPLPGSATCLAIVDDQAPKLTAAGHPPTAPATVASPPEAYMAADLQHAYRLPSALLGARQTIAVVDAYDDPNAASDLAAYRAANNLPACTADFPCLSKVNQTGGSTPPPADPTGGWELEESLDLDMASAICPNCRIVLVEADDNSDTNLFAAEDEAATLGANVISNSWGEPEYSGEAAAGTHFDHPGTVIVASSGDSGFGVMMPAALPTVVSAGGTALYPDSSRRGWTDAAWPGAGSGCSAFVAKPSWQHDQMCAKRTVADVSAVADPATPVAVYDTDGFPGWVAVGGTSVASPLIAGVYALAGNTGSITPGAYLYAHRSDLVDVTGDAMFDGVPGPDGLCGGEYLCTAVKGYDGPTGNGTPNGIGAF